MSEFMDVDHRGGGDVHDYSRMLHQIYGNNQGFSVIQERNSFGLPPQQDHGPPEIGAHEVEKLAIMGDGSFGTVYRGRCRSKDVAIKVLHTQDWDEKTLAAFRQEVAIVSKIFHPNIVLFMGACTVPGNMMIITELMPKGDLETLLQDHKKELSLLLRMRMAKDAALGITWLHGSNPQFIHRDLKTSNLLVDENYRIKICDFGLSQIKAHGEKLSDGIDGAKGTPLWMAPEVMMGKEFNEKCDVYSFGIVLWELLTREEPYQEFTTFEEFRHAVCYKHARPQIPPNTNPNLRTLIECCWQPDPERRPSFPQIVNALEHVMVDCAISDEVGRRLWKEKFLSREWVSWSQMQDALFDLLDYWGDTSFHPLPDNASYGQLQEASKFQLEEYSGRSGQHKNVAEKEFHRRKNQCCPLTTRSDEQLECLKALLIETSKGESREDFVVTLENFGNVLAWFGPIVDFHLKRVILLDTIHSILSQPWFHGDIGQSDAEQRLQGRGDGTFLIRFSSIVGCYTVSKIQGRVLSHQRIIHKPGSGYSINYHTYNTLPELIQSSKNELGLTQSCPGSRFSSIFKAYFQSGYIQNV